MDNLQHARTRTRLGRGLSRLFVLFILTFLAASLLSGCGASSTPSAAPLAKSYKTPQQYAQAAPTTASDANAAPKAAASSDDPYADDAYADDSYLDEYADEKADTAALAPDPIAGWNRAMFWVNDKLYFYALKPVAQVWRAVIPEAPRKGIKNAFYNAKFPIRFINSLLQGKLVRAGQETGRFLLNTVFGFGGLLTPSDAFEDLNPPAEDTGQTFGTWGAGNGFYIVWPFFGPSTVRDSVGQAGDYFLDPLTWVFWADDDLDWLQYTLTGVEVVNDTSFRIGDYEALKESAVDPYVSMRNAYLQYRQKKVEQ